MQLILNGGGEGNLIASAREKLNEIIDHSKKALYIPLAWPDFTYEGCLEFMTQELSDVEIPGIEMIRSKEELMSKNFNNYSFIYIGGGNTYKLLYELKISGAFDKIRNYLLNDNGIVYGGSAGAIIFGYSLDSCNLDDTNEVNLSDNTGFNMIGGYSLLCHFTNRDKEKTIESEKYLIELSNKIPIIAIPEEDTIYVNDSNIEFIGSKPYYIFEKGKMKKIEVLKKYKNAII